MVAWSDRQPDRVDRQRLSSIPVSVLTHVVVFGVLVASSYVLIDPVQEPDVVISFHLTAAPPPPPPPPPGGARPKAFEPTKPVLPPETLLQPVEVPTEIAEVPSPEGDEWAEGGVEGGVPGGVPGGVVGGGT